VVDALILATEKDGALGERFLISSAVPVTWGEFYAAFGRVLGIQSVVLMPTKEIEEIVSGYSIASKLRLFQRDPRRLLNWTPVRFLIVCVRSGIGEHLWKKTRKVLPAVPASLDLPSEQTLSLYRAHAFVRIDKARRILGYEPNFDFARGMEITSRYIRWANL
jgi:nucleoside-diphosphate-sugar epimerase